MSTGTLPLVWSVVPVGATASTGSFSMSWSVALPQVTGTFELDWALLQLRGRGGPRTRSRYSYTQLPDPVMR